MPDVFPSNLDLLHQGEELLRAKSVELIESNTQLLLHAVIIEQAMDLLDVFRQYPTDNEDLKVVQMLALRLFNAMASSTKLLLGGYAQTSALIARDILETVFLLDFFRTSRSSITCWRLADRKVRLRDFKPVKIREALDCRDGFDTKKRGHLYSLFSELAGHPSMPSVAMLRPKGMDARNGPFLDPTTLDAVLSELGKLAVQVGEMIIAFMPVDWDKGRKTAQAFSATRLHWMAVLYGMPTRESK